MADLYWSEAWAQVVGADGPVITDLLGRQVPCMTDGQRDDLRVAWRDRYPVGSEITPDLKQAGNAADHNGLRAVLACAIQSCDRALRTHITGPAESDDWHRWVGLDAPLHALMRALVLRRLAPEMQALVGPWERVMGELPAFDGLMNADSGPECCLECRRPLGARLVFEADAARQVQSARAAWADNVKAAREREDVMHRRMRDWQGHYLSVATVRDGVEQTLNWPGKVPARVREWIAEQLRFRLQISIELDERRPAQGELFEATEGVA